MKKHMGKITRICCLLPVLLFLFPSSRVQAEGIQARYLENNGNRSILELTVEKPPPSSIIVQQTLPPGAVIQSASPAYKKFVAQKGVVKWLFKRPKPGVIHVVLTYTNTKKSGGKGATAVIRCKSPITGELMTLHVQ